MVNDFIGGRLVPFSPPNHEPPDFSVLARNIFRRVWGLEPKDSDITLIQNEIEDFFMNLSKQNIQHDEDIEDDNEED